VLFAAFTVHVRHRPYMGKGDEVSVIADLEAKAAAALEDESLLPMREINRNKLGAEFWEDASRKAKINSKKSLADKYFFDLNAVEAILMGALILISVAGIMFDSNYYQQRAINVSEEDVAWQYQLVIIVTFVVLVGSLIYFIMVLCNELFPRRFAQICGKLVLRYKTDTVAGQDPRDAQNIVLDVNPLLSMGQTKQDQTAVIMERELESMKMQIQVAKKQNEELRRLRDELGTGDQ